MKKKILPLFLLFFLIFPNQIFAAEHLQNLPALNSQNDLSGTVPGIIIVKYKSDKLNLGKKAGRTLAGNVEKQIGVSKQAELADLNMHVVKTDQNVNDTIKQLEQDTSVEYAQPDYKKYFLASSNDPYFNLQWALQNTGQTISYKDSGGNTISKTGTAGDDIKAASAWNTETSNQTDVIVADIDSGADYTHEDLANNMWNGSSYCVDDTNAPIAGNCPYHGWNYADGNNNPMDVYDSANVDNGHGTMVGGIFAAQTNNSKGVSGLSYYNHIKLMALKFGMDSVGEIKAINFAKYNGAKIINASFGGADYDQAEKDAIDAFPGLVVASAGNNTQNNDLTPLYPASYTSSNIISVAATDQNDSLASFSDWGASSVDIGAPGENIVSTYNSSGSAYAIGDGTSFAAPYVSGAAALAISNSNNVPIQTLKNYILSSGDSVTSLSGKTVTGKRLNLQNLLQTVSSNTASTPVLSPTSGTYASTQSVSITTSTSGATIYYTTDGSTPTTSSNVYANPISVSATTNIKAIATKSGMISSNTASENYVFNNPIPIYRFWSDQKQGHFYTASQTERDYVISNYPTNVWHYEGVAFNAFDNGSSANVVPIYRFWSDDKQHHFYTASEDEKNYVIANYPTHVWKYEGIAYYAYLTQQPNSTAVYRFWSDQKQGHFYTASSDEKDYIISHYPTNVWKYEGVAWYVPTN